MKNKICPLCKSESILLLYKQMETYYSCKNCKGIYIAREQLPDKDYEFSRYVLHKNDINDVRYQNFVAPIINKILCDFTPKHIGLDFGSGKAPVITELLKTHKYVQTPYDPFFFNNQELLLKKYDYITCCEVIEHFHYPAKEFEILKNLLTPNGKLYFKTRLYNSTLDFKHWYYKDDPTHVFFYQIETMTYIQHYFGFDKLEISDNVIIFTL